MINSFNTNLKNVASTYVKLIPVKITISSLQKALEENPFYPSLLSLSDTFTRYRINNNAFEISEENFDQLEPPFVSYIAIPGVGKDFCVVTNIGLNTISYIHKGKKNLTLPKEEFLRRYQNVVWVAEPDANSGEADFEKKLKKERTIKLKRLAWFIGFAGLALFAIATGIDTSFALAYGSIVLMKVFGLAISVILLMYETDKSSVFVKNICGIGSKTNCDAVLGSKASRVMGISWGEIGFFYFASTFLFCLLPNIPFSFRMGWLAIANAAAAPYIIFSVYYQSRVIKQWCLLCLAIQITLLSELIWSVMTFWTVAHSFYPALAHLSALLFCVMAPIMAWYGLKPVFVKVKDADLHNSAYKRLQYNPDIFNSLLHQQGRAPDGWQKLGISIGNPSAPNVIIKVCNPNCGPCARAHPVLEDIVKTNKDVQVRIIFTVKRNENDIGMKAARSLMAISAEGEGVKILEALDTWYLSGKKDPEHFASQYLIKDEVQLEQNHKIEAMNKWCEDADITHTPTIFVNGYLLPENYNIIELKSIL